MRIQCGQYVMTTIIHELGIAKPSHSSPKDRLRLLNNEHARVQRRLKDAQAKLAGLFALEGVLPRYLQPGDFEHLRELLQRDVERWTQELNDIKRQLPDARLDAQCNEFNVKERWRKQDEEQRLALAAWRKQQQ
jgi:hypothetical protein